MISKTSALRRCDRLRTGQFSRNIEQCLRPIHPRLNLASPSFSEQQYVLPTANLRLTSAQAPQVPCTPSLCCGRKRCGSPPSALGLRRRPRCCGRYEGDQDASYIDIRIGQTFAITALLAARPIASSTFGYASSLARIPVRHGYTGKHSFRASLQGTGPLATPASLV